jgi:hypothetical protein
VPDAPELLKRCRRCGEEKPLDAFGTYTETRLASGIPEQRHHARCGPCRSRAAQEWNEANPERAAASRLRSSRKHARTRAQRRRMRTYGLTETALAALEASQAGHCAICREFVGDALVMDHDHVTGEVRGLLCPPCNKGLGSFRDDPRRMLRAVRYLLAGGIGDLASVLARTGRH